MAQPGDVSVDPLQAPRIAASSLGAPGLGPRALAGDDP